MSTPLTAEQLTTLAGLFSQYADTEFDANDKQPAPTPTALTQIGSLTDLSNNLATAGAATAFNDAAAAYQQLTVVTTQANAKATALTADVAKFGRIVTIGTDVIAVGASLSSGNPGAVLAAAKKLQETLNNN